MEPLPRARRTPASQVDVGERRGRSPPTRAGRRRTSARAARGRAAPPGRCPRGAASSFWTSPRCRTCGSAGSCAARAGRRSGRARAGSRGAGGGRTSAGTRPCAGASPARPGGRSSAPAASSSRKPARSRVLGVEDVDAAALEVARRTAAGRSGRPPACCATARARTRGSARKSRTWCSNGRWAAASAPRRWPCRRASRRAPGSLALQAAVHGGYPVGAPPISCARRSHSRPTSVFASEFRVDEPVEVGERPA